jgi:hypothetical protein
MDESVCLRGWAKWYPTKAVEMAVNLSYFESGSGKREGATR